MKYMTKAPTIDAVRFIMQYEERMSGCELRIEIRKDEAAIMLRRGDYFVVVMPEEEFDRKYEPVPEAA